jgi:hypothetical protein
MSRLLSIEQLESRITMDAAGGAMSFPMPEGEGDPRPAFQLEDVNPASPRFGESVSPRDYLSQVSAWYFGHST